MDLLQRRRQVGAGAQPMSAQAAPGAAPAPAPAQPHAAPQQRGSGFVGFDRYFQANQAGAQRMAQTVGDKVEKEAKEGAQAISAGQDDFAARSQAANLAYDPSKAPTAARARELAATTYTGPKDWNEGAIKTASKEVGEASGAVAGLGSAGGISNLLRESYRSPAQTAGASGLDAALAGAAGGGRFAQLQSAYGDLGERLINARGQAGTTYDANLAGTKDAAARYGTLAGALSQQEAAAALQRENALATEAAQRMDIDMQHNAGMDGQWSQEEADRLDDIKSGRSRRQIRRG